MRCVLMFAIVVVASVAQQPTGSTNSNQSQTSTAPAKNAPEKAPPKRVVADLSGFELDPNKSNAQALQIGAGARGALLPPPLYAPKLGKAYSLRPVFSWGDSPGAENFTFRLYDSDNEEVYENEVGGNVRSFTYPADAPPLTAGSTYSWTVQAMAAQLIEPPQPVRLLLISGPDRQGVEQALESSKGNDLAARRLQAQAFVQHRLWYDAIAAYSQLISENRNNSDLYRERAQIYAQLPATEALATQDMERARKLDGQQDSK
jgi:Domain of Unknown Function (DUF928)